jgi:hypothetical protein
MAGQRVALRVQEENVLGHELSNDSHKVHDVGGGGRICG